jgi:hypothetical protein
MADRYPWRSEQYRLPQAQKAGSAEEVTEVHTEVPCGSVDTWGVEVGREEGTEQGRQGMQGWRQGRTEDTSRRRPVSFAIVSNHLLSFSILSMDSYDMKRRGARVCEEGEGRKETNTHGHDRSPDGRGYHRSAGTDLFEPM